METCRAAESRFRAHWGKNCPPSSVNNANTMTPLACGFLLSASWPPVSVLDEEETSSGEVGLGGAYCTILPCPVQMSSIFSLHLPYPGC